MSKDELKIENIPQTSSKKNEENASLGRAILSRRHGPFTLAISLTLIWLIFTGYLAFQEGGILSEQSSPSDLLIIAGGLASPIIVFWLVAMVFQRTDPLLERRLEIAQGMDKAISPIDEAEKRLKRLTKNLNNQISHIEASSDIAVQRIEMLENRFQSQINDLFSATTDAEAKAVSLKDMLMREREELQKFSGDLDERMANIEKTMANITQDFLHATSTAQNEAVSAGIMLKDQTSALEKSALHTNKTLTNLGEHLDRQRDNLRKTTLEACANLDTTFDGLETRTSEITREINSLDQNTRELTVNLQEQAGKVTTLAAEAADSASTFDESIKHHTNLLSSSATGALAQAAQASDEFKKRAVELQKISTETLAHTEAMFDELNATLTTQSTDANNTAKQTAEIALEQLEKLRSNLADQAKAIENSANDNSTNFGQISSNLAKQAELISASGRAAAEGMREMGDSMDERQGTLGQLLEDTKARFQNTEEELYKQRQSLAEATELSTNSLRESVGGLKNETLNLATHGQDIKRQLSELTDGIRTEIVTLEEQSTGTVSKMHNAGERLNKESGEATTSISNASNAFSEAAELFGSKRAKFEGKAHENITHLNEVAKFINSETNTLIAGTEKTSENLKDLTEKLTTVSERVTNNAALASSVTDQSAIEMENRIESSFAKSKQNLDNTLEHMQTNAQDGLANLHVRFAHAMDKALLDLENANVKAREQAEKSAGYITEEANQLLSRGEKFIKEAQSLDEKLTATMKDDFIKSSSLIIEGLNSATLDINKALEVDIPDSTWKKYLKGDHSIFARRTVKIGNRKIRLAITSKFDQDPDFRNNVVKFTKGFEILMQRVMTEVDANPLSVTLVSSELGKLYVLLAQSTNKMES